MLLFERLFIHSSKIDAKKSKETSIYIQCSSTIDYTFHRMFCDLIRYTSTQNSPFVAARQTHGLNVSSKWHWKHLSTYSILENVIYNSVNMKRLSLLNYIITGSIKDIRMVLLLVYVERNEDSCITSTI